MSSPALSRFHPQVATWFSEVFAQPTAVQEEAWEHISCGRNALVIAPTGSGKTLAAFLWALNSLVAAPQQRQLPLKDVPGSSRGEVREARGVSVLYISPLKALGVDVERNLRAPLTGIGRVAERLDMPGPSITVAVRSGDTPQSERARQIRKPPDILITTPESAYLLLTSRGARILSSVRTVIVDEIHALAGTKRGSHLALTLERLEHLVEAPVQRIGLSATVRPPESVAAFLGGDRPVEIVQPDIHKRWDLSVTVPVPDLSDLPTPHEGSTIGEITVQDPHGLIAKGSSESALPTARSIWPFLERDLYQEIMRARSTLIFVNSRRTAERVTSRLNELWAEEHDPEALSAPLRRPPAQLMKAVDVAGEARAVIAKAHHGSVSKEERALTEEMLKSGQLRAVVATSSLELGIDMGAVDQVIQVEAPPSVASGLQRVGRAGHAVGGVSRGIFHPKHRADVVHTAVTIERMRAGLIEEVRIPTNALDVLAQHTVAAAAVEDLDVEVWWSTVRRAYPYRELPRQAFDSVIDLVSGAYPSTDFAELRPRLLHDRLTGTLRARPGAQRVAVTSGGTIPDRGMFGVYLVGTEGQRAPRRVGELDEEMVYESRVGDVFTLGASSWQIAEIDKDRVMVTPAPGHTGRLPFWNGDQAGRPVELGKAVGVFRREVLADPHRLSGLGLDENAEKNVLAFLSEQREAMGIVPDERTLVVERFRDEVGDWRVVLHSPYGRPVNAAWALAVGARVSSDTGIDAQPVVGDDGIVLRLPDADVEPGASLFAIDPTAVRDTVAARVGDSALFASRFRECAARALLLPRRSPGKRAPLWQQRQRAAQLLDVARRYPQFPIILETVRECLRDVYDLDALVAVLEDIQAHRIRIAEVTVDQPSPFASSLLFSYTGAFIYEGDSPLAEKRAAALALDPALLKQLLGEVDLSDLLDPELIEEINGQLQRTDPERRARSEEQLADMLRLLGPLTEEELAQRCTWPCAWAHAVAELRGRVMEVRIGGVRRLAAVEDAAVLRDALGVPVPPGVSVATELVPDALEQVVGRLARTRGPFTARELADAYGLGVSAVVSALTVLEERGDVVTGRYRCGRTEREYCAAPVLRILRSRALAAARSRTRPVSPSAFARFLASWQGVAPVGERPAFTGVDGTFAVLEQLAGVRLPASAWETIVLPSRVADYEPRLLDELVMSGEVLIQGCGAAGSRDPWLMLLPADYAAQLVPHEDRGKAGFPLLQEGIIQFLEGGGSYLFSDIAAGCGVPATAEELRDALWELLEAGELSPDSMAPVRARLAGQGNAGSRAHRARRSPTRSRLRLGRTSFSHAAQEGRLGGSTTPPDAVGRWSRSLSPDATASSRAVAHGEAWLDRYGVVTRGSVVAENVTGGFSVAYRVLREFEASGRAIRGYFIEGLGAAQFSSPAVIDRLRSYDDTPDVTGWPSGAQHPRIYVVAAADPANPYGAGLPWPTKGPTRAAGALVILADGLLAGHLTRGGRHLSVFTDLMPVSEEETVAAVYHGLRAWVGQSGQRSLTVERINGEAALGSAMASRFHNCGAGRVPAGIRITATGTSGSSGARRGRSISEALAELEETGEREEPSAPHGEHGRREFLEDIPRGPRGGPSVRSRWRRR